MCWTVFTDADRVVSKNVSGGKFRNRGEPYRSPAIIGKYCKRCSRCAEQPVIRDAVKDGAHPMFADTGSDLRSARVITIEFAAAVDVVHCRSVQIGTAAHQ